MDQSILRQIPKMDKLLEREIVRTYAADLPRALVRETAQQVLDSLRTSLLHGGEMPSEEQLDALLADALDQAQAYRLRRLVNATGIVLHTNLGRAPLGHEIAAHIADVAEGYSNLEYDLDAGARGSRYSHVEELLCRVTGAEAALVVNNNAAAVFLMLNTMAKGKGVAISRGELVEIGGSFRVPEIMAESGGILVEVGTTNKTRISDYRKAVEEQDALVLLKVHSSNFKVIGFTESASLAELHELAREKGIPLLYDLGAAFLVNPSMLGLHEGENLKEAAALADVVSFSGDKLLGAGQAGIILGKKEYIQRMKRNQLTRMLRVDKMTLAALEAVLRWYADPAQAVEHIPVLRMLKAPEGELKSSALLLSQRLRETCACCNFEAVPCSDEPGGGSLPGVELSGWAVAVTSQTFSSDLLEQTLRGRSVPIIARIHHDRLLLSVRTMTEKDFDEVCTAFTELGAQA